MRRTALAFLGLSFLCLSTQAGDAPASTKSATDRVIEVGQSDNTVMEKLDYLVNRIGPRLTGSHNDITACEWVRDQFEEWGLENVTMEEAGEFPVQFHRGPWSGKMIAPIEMALEFGTPAWSAGTKGAVKGPAKLVPSDTEGLEASDYDGAWILMKNAPRRRGQSREERQEAQKKSREVRRWLEEAGVVGFIHATRSDKYITTGGNPRVKWDALPQFPRINMLSPHWNEISERLEKGEKVELQFDIRNHFSPKPATFYNVYGDIVGSEFPDEYVLVGGHIDSWDGATGTTDNGTGSAVAIETARLLIKAGVKPRRTIRFVLWSGEEQGLLGSRAYCEKYESELKNISAVLNYDGGPNAIAGIEATPAMQEDFEKVFAPVFDLNPDIPFEIQRRENGLSASGSDHVSYMRAGVPGFFWIQKGRADWRHGIHTQFDTYDLAIPEYLEHSATVSALAALGIANLDGLLSREKLQAPRGRGGRGGRMMGVFLDNLAVNALVPDGVAEKAGMKAGDQFVKVDGKTVGNRAELVSAIRAGAPTKEVTVKRGSAMVQLVFKWEEEKKETKPKKKIVF